MNNQLDINTFLPSGHKMCKALAVSWTSAETQTCQERHRASVRGRADMQMLLQVPALLLLSPVAAHTSE